jgi:hypothetical protein
MLKRGNRLKNFIPAHIDLLPKKGSAESAFCVHAARIVMDVVLLTSLRVAPTPGSSLVLEKSLASCLDKEVELTQAGADNVIIYK